MSNSTFGIFSERVLWPKCPYITSVAEQKIDVFFTWAVKLFSHYVDNEAFVARLSLIERIKENQKIMDFPARALVPQLNLIQVQFTLRF